MTDRKKENLRNHNAEEYIGIHWKHGKRQSYETDIWNMTNLKEEKLTNDIPETKRRKLAKQYMRNDMRT